MAFSIPAYLNSSLTVTRTQKPKKWWQRLLPVNWNPVGMTLGQSWLQDIKKDYFEVEEHTVYLIDPSSISFSATKSGPTIGNMSFMLSEDAVVKLVNLKGG